MNEFEKPNLSPTEKPETEQKPVEIKPEQDPSARLEQTDLSSDILKGKERDQKSLDELREKIKAFPADKGSGISPEDAEKMLVQRYENFADEIDGIKRIKASKEDLKKFSEDFQDLPRAISACKQLGDFEQLKKVAEFAEGAGKITETRNANMLLNREFPQDNEIKEKHKKYEFLHSIQKAFYAGNDRMDGFDQRSMEKSFPEYAKLLDSNKLGEIIKELGGEKAFEQAKEERIMRYFERNNLTMSNNIFESGEEFRQAASRFYKLREQPIQSLLARMGLVISIPTAVPYDRNVEEKISRYRK